ncbi:MAG: hypothetical protein JXC32_10220 [Anaerolineae bacterium]|nr:hypothetical protein [Anaerolineae bacterium]
MTVPCWEAASAWEAEPSRVLSKHSHHPSCCGVFNALHYAQPGQEIAYDGQHRVVTHVQTGLQPEDAHWLWPTTEPRLTMITHWPAHSTRSRMVVVAQRVQQPPAASSYPAYTHF